MTNTNLIKANLKGVDLSQSIISNTDLRGANLLGAKLPDFKNSPFPPPKLDGTIMPDGSIYQENSAK